MSAATALWAPLLLLPIRKEPDWDSRVSCLLTFPFSGLNPWGIRKRRQRLSVQMQEKDLS